MSIEQMVLLLVLAVITLVRAFRQAAAKAELERRAGGEPAPGELEVRELEVREPEAREQERPFVPAAPVPVPRFPAPVRTPPPPSQRSPSVPPAPSLGRSPVSPAAYSRPGPVWSIPAELRSAEGLRRAFVLAAVVGPPRSLDPP